MRTPSTDQSSRRSPHRKNCTRTVNYFIGRHTGTGSTFTRGHCILGRRLESRRPLRVLSLMPTHRRLRLEWCRARGNWTAEEWNQVVFSDESRFNLSNDDNCVRVWRPRGERLNPALALQRHTAPTADVILLGAIAYNTRSFLELIRGTMTAQRYVHDILQPHVLPLMQRLPGTFFQQDNSRPPTARVSQDCLHTVSTLTWPARSPDLSPIEHIWDHLGRRVGHPTSLNELEARLQQIWNEMSQDMIQNLYVSVPDGIALWNGIAFGTGTETSVEKSVEFSRP
ncbi:transposable element Tcb2 transposase [Trichonephila clavipes]|nr:transposable element Tcb2 transposase [Trichonephila clavipes]